MSFGNSISGSRWRIEVCGLDGVFPDGSGPVFNASGKSFSYQINSGRQMTWSMTMDNPRISYILNNDCIAKVYRKTLAGNWQLMMVGDIVSMEEKGQGDIGSVTCVAADPFWRLAFRYLGTSTDGYGRGIGYQLGTVSSPMDLSAMLQQIVTDSNGIGNTGVQIGTIQNSGQTKVLGPLYVVSSSDTIQQIIQTTGGPDFELAPIEPSGAWPTTKIATFNVYTHLGVVTPDPSAMFEYGMGRNTIASYDRLITKSNIANYIFSMPQGFPTMSAASDTIVSTQDSTSIANRGIFEYYMNDNLISIGLRQALIDETLTILKDPRQQLTFVPVVDCPIDYGVNYKVGDVISVRAFDKTTGTIRFAGTIRVYGVQIDSNEEDAETITLTCTPSGESGTTFPNVPSGGS